MPRSWKTAHELAEAMHRRASSGRNVVLSPATALWLAREMQVSQSSQDRPPQKRSIRDIDLYSSGSCVYQLNEAGEDVELVAWARNAGVAKTAFEELQRREPNTRLRRRGWVEAK